MIEIFEAPNYLLHEKEWLNPARQKQLHLVSPAVLGEQNSVGYALSLKKSPNQASQNQPLLVAPAGFGKPVSFACEALEDILTISDIVRYFNSVNEAVDIGSLWPMRYVSLLPAPPHHRKPNWYNICLDMFKVHFMKNQSFVILVLLDAGVYPDTDYIKKELCRAGSDYPVPNNQKNPLAYFYTEV